MRLVNVLKKDYMEMRRTIFIYFATIIAIVGGIVILRTVFTSYIDGTNNNLYGSFFSGFFFLGGAIFTSILFSDEMFNRVRVHNFLMLPASNEEKFLSKAIFSAILYPLSIIALFFLTSTVVELLLFIALKDPITIFNPFQKDVLNSIPDYFIMSSLFFLGSTYFRKIHFIKTIFTSSLVVFSFAIALLIFARIILAPYFQEQSLLYVRVSFLEKYDSIPAFVNVLGKFIYFIVFPLFFFYVSFLRIKEVQSTDAIQ